MANINIENISDLALNGNKLFEDSESFMTELDDDNDQIIGGGEPVCVRDTCVNTVQVWLQDTAIEGVALHKSLGFKN